ncbi:MAG: UDP-N-acetylmuramoyl-L-alanine--D-glutamate ligase, partial [Phycisphaeraceae bacterium]
QAVGPDRVHVGGNIGGSLLDKLHAIQNDHWIVLELSSFMLDSLDQDAWSPGTAVVTNFAPNHLDWHGRIEDYTTAKQVILKHQSAGDRAILGQTVAHWPTNPGVERHAVKEMDRQIDLALPGQHNRFNAMCAITFAEAAAIGGINLLHSLGDFAGLPHRLQFVCEHHGVRYFNDSKSTTPDAAILALRSFDAGTVHIILGGYDKGSDLKPLAGLASQHCRVIYTIGTTGDAIADAAEASAGRAGIIRCGTLERAIKQITGRTQQGDVVLLSPGCASLDQFSNYEHRGAAFTEAVSKCPGDTDST